MLSIVYREDRTAGKSTARAATAASFVTRGIG
jgi:hypothetical protein